MNPPSTVNPLMPDLLNLCHSLLERSPLPTAELEGAGHVLRYVNPAFCRLVGKSAEALLGTSFADTVQAGDACLALLERVYRTGEAETHTETGRPVPSPVYWSYAMWPVLDTAHHPVGVLVQVTETTEFHHQTVAMNEALVRSSVRQHELTAAAEQLNAHLQAEIAERQQTETALRASEDKYHQLFDSMDEGFCLLEKLEGAAGEPAEFRYVEANPAFAAHSGVSGVVGKTISQAFPGEPETWKDWYDAVLTTGEPRRVEGRLVTHGRLLDLYAFRVQDATQRRVAVLFTDVTAHRHAEEARLRLATIVASSNDAIISKSLDGIITSWNAAAERLFGYRAEEMIGQPILRLLPEEQQDKERLILERLRQGEHVDSFEIVFQAKAGRFLDVLVTISPLQSERGTVIGSAQIARDITVQKHQARELAQRAAELERLNAELQQFSYVTSHDLQEPLRTITSYVQLLAQQYKGKLDPEADEYIGFAVDGTQRMQALITALLAYTRAGKTTQAFTTVDCETVLADTMRDLQLALHDTAAAITHAPLPTVQGDATQVGLVFQNLIGNALKFHGTAPPRVHIAVQREGQHWRFAVQDNGIGLDPQHAERIFQIFQRLHTRREYPGTGIGLAICKKIVERHGGHMWVESAPGHGSTFFFTLPATETGGSS